MNPNQTQIPQANPTSTMQPIAPQNNTSTIASSFNTAIQKAQSDPTSPYAQELMTRIKSGQMNDYLTAAGYDPSKFITQQPSVAPAPISTPSSSGDAGNVSDVGKTASDFAASTNSHAANILQDLSEKPSFGGAADVVGNVAGETNDLIGSLIKTGAQATMPKPIYDFLNMVIGAGVKAVSNTQSAQGYASEWNKLSAEYPEATKSVAGIAQAAGLMVGSEVSPSASVEDTTNAIKTGAETAVNASKNTIAGAASGAKNLVMGDASTLPDVVGKITQASPDELPAATRALKSVDLSGSKTFSDVSTKLDNAIKANTAEVDSRLGASNDLLKPSDVEKTIPIKGGDNITTNSVNDSLKQLSDFYTKTNNPEELANIKQLQAKFESEGLTPKEINDLARTHGQALNGFNANGELASGLSRQAAENTRTALKTTAREAMPDAATRAIDKNTTDLIKTKGMVDDMATKVQSLENKLKTFTPLQKAGQFAGKAVNMATGGALKTFIKGLTGFGMDEGTTLNALQLQDSLTKNLQLLDKLNSMSPEEATTKISSILKTK